ncbi:sialate O-acetylesterase [Aeoliella mucimassa]|uniref:Sialate O-acetylesterase domain-containing protein n=1 Tax=Aeoliella mucimassa TaxID=2527972 RepID=A0A518AVH0_9BACT|nr:sialate O-acetylesterase [Aeoliella mucimassa]QDU58713.1 hypothetical protein Pan181_49530 [Aeoliella mucimassa]
MVTGLRALRLAVLTILVTLFASQIAMAQEPASLVADVFSDHMVLQRDRQIPVWGHATADSEVSVQLGDNDAVTAKADSEGRWMVKLPPQSAGGPVKLTCTSGEQTVEISDVLIGEVWVCSGQSNMHWNVKTTNSGEEAIASANFHSLRLMQVPLAMSATPEETCDAKWVACTPESVPNFSAVAFYFGRELHKELDVPVGLIHTSWGGSLCEAWTSREALESDPDYSDILKRSEENLKNGTGMYNKMIHPFIPYGIRGAIWYQGESNVSRAVQYRKLFPTMIRDWRTRWGQGDFPFYFVQLAPYNYGGNSTAFPELQEAQTMTLDVPNTGMAVTNDIGNVSDIHPRNKVDVGERLAAWALANTYGKEDLVYSGPLYSYTEIDGNEARVHFDHVDGGLASRDGEPLTWFSLAGSDREFHPAEARIEGDTVVVTSPDVPAPVAVRFAWSDTAEPNLMNKAGLPASSFRSDRWTEVTAGRK